MDVVDTATQENGENNGRLRLKLEYVVLWMAAVLDRDNNGQEEEQGVLWS